MTSNAKDCLAFPQLCAPSLRRSLPPPRTHFLSFLLIRCTSIRVARSFNLDVYIDNGLVNLADEDERARVLGGGPVASGEVRQLSDKRKKSAFQVTETSHNLRKGSPTGEASTSLPPWKNSGT